MALLCSQINFNPSDILKLTASQVEYWTEVLLENAKLTKGFK